MTVASIMTTRPITVAPDDTVAIATGKLIAGHYMTLPVVHMGKQYAGVFGMAELARLILPRGAMQEGLRVDLSFLGQDGSTTLRRHYEEASGRPVKDFMRTNLTTLRSDDPLAEALSLCLYEHSSIPVVDPKTRELQGIVAYWDVLTLLTGTVRS